MTTLPALSVASLWVAAGAVAALTPPSTATVYGSALQTAAFIKEDHCLKRGNCPPYLEQRISISPDRDSSGDVLVSARGMRGMWIQKVTKRVHYDHIHQQLNCELQFRHQFDTEFSFWEYGSLAPRGWLLKTVDEFKFQGYYSEGQETDQTGEIKWIPASAFDDPAFMSGPWAALDAHNWSEPETSGTSKGKHIFSPPPPPSGGHPPFGDILTGVYPNSDTAPPGWDDDFGGYAVDLGTHAIEADWHCPIPFGEECPTPTEELWARCLTNGVKTIP
jgi:hypothetical protein